MSMSKCKCDKIFDTDDQLGFDEKGNCCCDVCYEEMMAKFDIELNTILAKHNLKLTSTRPNCDEVGTLVESLMDEGYRKIQ